MLVLPQRQVVLLAKQLTSLDVLSAVRLTVGVAAGYLEPELRALGVDPPERAPTDDFLAAMRALWDEPAAPFAGLFTQFDGVLQRPNPPFIVGGHAQAAYRRAVTAGNGWYGWGLNSEQTAAALAELRALGGRVGRPTAVGEQEVSSTPPDRPDAATARRHAEVGVHWLVPRPDEFVGDEIDQLVSYGGDTLVGMA